MKIISCLFLFFCLASTAVATCYEDCHKIKRDGDFIGCLKPCYPEIINFCEGRFPKADKQSASYKMAIKECIKYSHPCQDKCQSQDKVKEKSCRNECLGN